MDSTSRCKLSICISTLNRASFLGAAIDSILDQVTGECELVVSDNASTDNTELIVAERARCSERLRYFKQDDNRGADRNIDRAVAMARGDYCWIFSDDDVMKQGGVATILDTLRHDYSLILVNMELMDCTMSHVVRPRWINFDSDRLYEAGEADRMFAELDGTVVNLCNIIINRALWLSRDRERYYGSNFVHTGVIFQQPLPGPALVVAQTLIRYRAGNVQSFASDWPEIWLVRWPAVVESLAIADSAKRSVRTSRPWSSPLWLLVLRSAGYYSLSHYRRWVRPRTNSIHQRIVSWVIATLPHSAAGAILSLHRYVRRLFGCRPITLFTDPT